MSKVVFTFLSPFHIAKQPQWAWKDNFYKGIHVTRDSSSFLLSVLHFQSVCWKGVSDDPDPRVHRGICTPTTKNTSSLRSGPTMKSHVQLNFGLGKSLPKTCWWMVLNAPDGVSIWVVVGSRPPLWLSVVVFRITSLIALKDKVLTVTLFSFSCPHIWYDVFVIVISDTRLTTD